MIGECPDDQPASEIGSHSYFAYLEVKSIDELYEKYQLKKAEVLSAIENKPGGQRKFSVRTIDVHRITFGEEVSSDLFETFMENWTVLRHHGTHKESPFRSFLYTNP